ncbi:MAG TPA: LacI family DNA-binding transcriptional regulator [Polyangiaceae bacterium]|nr:LacI family DNA-binding transcriptional regulator [Polyangiaceae bacterium]
MARRTDIAEVARHARVSKSTVSRVINGGYASAEVRARVAKVIQKLNYTPWTTARNFSLGRAGCFGLVVWDTQSEWITQILGGIEEELTSKHISLLVGSLVLRGSYDSSTVASWISERRIDALIFACPGKKERPLVEAARKAQVSVALIAPNEAFRGAVVLRSDNIGVGSDIAQHLQELGHRRVAYVGGNEESLDSRERGDGVERGLAAYKLKIAPGNKLFMPRYHVDEGANYAQRWLKMPRSRAPTAVVLANDAMALGFMRTLQIQGVSIPRDVSVVGYDDIPAAGLYWPGLTTVRQEMRVMGSHACRAVMAAIENEKVERPVVEFPMKLIVRQSTGPAPEKA